MKKFKIISLLLVIILVFNFSVAHAVMGPKLSYSFFEILNYDNIISLTKGLLALFLISRLNLFSEDDQQETETSLQEGFIPERKPKGVLNTNKLDDKVIVIDPGHGGRDSGAVGFNGLQEKDIVLNISHHLYDILNEKTQAEVYLTRDNDYFVSLNNRSVIAQNAAADLFISIHNNADIHRQAQGVETYAHYNSSTEAWQLAWYLQKNLVEETGLVDGGIKAGNFQVLRETPYMKSVLLEIGYISHYTDEKFLNNSSNQYKSAEAIFNGLVEYFNLKDD